MANDVTYFDVTLTESNQNEVIKSIALKIRSNWKADDTLVIRDLNGGITNRLVACYRKEIGLDNSDTLLFRSYGKNTELFISRDSEIENMQLMKTIGLGPEFYCRFANGIAYEYLPGDIVHHELIMNPPIYIKIAKAVAHLHFVNFNGVLTESNRQANQVPFIFPKIKCILKLVDPNFKSNIKCQQKDQLEKLPSLTELYEELQGLEDHLTAYTKKTNSLIVFSHNDLLLGNIIYNEKDHSIKFIDYEYAEINYQAYDIANHFNEFAGVDAPDYNLFPSKEYQLEWIRVYLEELYGLLNGFLKEKTFDVNESLVNQFYGEVSKFTLASHFMWAVWSVVQAQSSQLEFDFVNYANIRFGEYFKRKSECFNIE